jgi:ATP-dependent Lon protease
MIARNFLIPKNLKEHGLLKSGLEFTENALYKIIDDYTREAGVRELERSIARICRRVARTVAQENRQCHKIKENNLEHYLGVPRYTEKEVLKGSRVGAANALAWTSEGGDILPIEVALMKGKGVLTLTGQLGEVMQESAKASLSYIRSIADSFGLDENDFLRREVHIHIPEGAVPKDGPSAGVALTLAMLSAFTGKPVPAIYGFTGEITLRGEILPIGGLPEKLMAANRLGIKTVFIPGKNRKDLKEIPAPVTKPLEIKMADNFKEVLKGVWGEDLRFEN